MEARKEKRMFTEIVSGKPSSTRQALRSLVQERARAEQRQRRRDGAKQRRAVELMWDCEICNRSAATCNCT